MIVDVHYHLYPFHEDWKLPPAAEAEQRARLESVRVDPDRQIETILDQMDACGVGWLGVVNAWHHPSITVPCPNEVFAAAIAPYRDRIFGWAGFPIHPSPDIGALRHAVEDLGFRGLKFIPPTQWFAPDDLGLMAPVYEAAIDLGVATIWHLGPGPFRMASRQQYGSLEALNEVAFRYPELKILIAHAGDLGREDLAVALCAFPNVYIEASVLTHHLMTGRFTPRHGADAADRYKRDVLWPDGAIDPEVQPAWDETLAKHQALIWKIANRAPTKFLFASDGPYGARLSYCVEAYRAAFAHDPALLTDIFTNNAARLLSLRGAE